MASPAVFSNLLPGLKAFFSLAGVFTFPGWR